VSEDPSIERFEPHVSATAASREPRVWAVDTRHVPFYWFPRQCPRGTFWATAATTPPDVTLLGDATRVHVIEAAWLEQMQATRAVAYRLPEESFEPDPEVGGYWLSTEPVRPLEVVELGDLVRRHEDAGIELRVVPSIWAVWDRVVASTLEYSGIRLHNAARRGV
jgi:hypothetical protein